MGVWRGFFSALKEIVYPKTCLACKKRLGAYAALQFLCQPCADKISRNKPPFCRRCGRHLQDADRAKGICPECIRNSPCFDRAFSPCVYEGVTKELIRQFKYQGKDYLGPLLAMFMVDFIRQYGLPMDVVDCIVPVPLHGVRMREREFNQAEALARPLAEAFSKELMRDCLMRTRHTRPQAELDGTKRTANVRGVFRVRDGQAVRGKNILLVDDVLTTGATSSEAACVLKESGAHIVFVMTLAN